MVGATLFAALAPMLFADSTNPESFTTNFPGWPGQYENKSLTELELTDRERFFVKDFPGKVGRFSDGAREIIIRWVESPTRRLHPAADCFKGVGYAMSPLPVDYNLADVPMGCFEATKDGQSRKICEFIIARDSAIDSNSWTDVSSWYWQTVLSNDNNGWWSYVIAENNLGSL